MLKEYMQQKLQKSPRTLEKGFTLIELLFVMAIIGLLAAIILASMTTAREKAYYSRTKEELHQLATALELYMNDHGGNYPADVNRSLPPGLETYLPGGNWPNAPWPGSVYDWDNWAPGDLSFAPLSQIYQISVRFCTDVNTCSFPNEPWAVNFDYNSAAYYCVSGPCRAHSSQPIDHAGYCINCGH